MTRDPSVTADALVDALLDLATQAKAATPVVRRRGHADLFPLHAAYRAVVAAEEAHDLATDGANE